MSLPVPISMSPKTLLIVDDEAGNVESLQRIFLRYTPPSAEGEPSKPKDPVKLKHVQITRE